MLRPGHALCLRRRGPRCPVLGDIGLGEASATGPSPARPHSASLVSLTRIPQAHPPSLGAWIAPEAALMKRSFAFLGAALLCSLAVVSDVHAQQAWNSVTLSWTTPGDDSLSGSASQFDIRYSTSPIT